MKKPDALVSDARRAHNDALLKEALEANFGPRHWVEWKAQQARDIVESCANRAERLELLDITLEGDFTMIYRIDMPVPRRPQDGKLTIARGAVFGLKYRDEWRLEAPAGYEPLALLEPNDPYHPNCQPSLLGACCLGNDLPPGVAPKEILLRGYSAIQLELVTLDPRDPSGVLNPEACEYFRAHQEYLPLSRAGLFESWNGIEGVEGVKA